MMHEWKHNMIAWSWSLVVGGRMKDCLLRNERSLLPLFNLFVAIWSTVRRRRRSARGVSALHGMRRASCARRPSEGTRLLIVGCR